MNVRQCVAVNEYGSCLMSTVADAPQASADLFRDLFGRDPDELGCCVVRLVPVVEIGRPHGYWARQDDGG
jgi:hypothetical protein